MSIFDTMLSWLGFENNKEGKPRKEKKQKENKDKKQVLGTKFSFEEEKKSEHEGETKVEFENEFASDIPTTSSNLAVFSPKELDELKDIIDYTRRRQSAIINLSSFEEEEFDQALQFLNGAMYAMRGSVKTLDKKLFVLSPAGAQTIVEK